LSSISTSTSSASGSTRDGRGRRVNAALRFGRRYALHAVRPGLPAERAERTVAGHAEHRFLEAT
jgi:hypothetical protein